MPNNNLTGGNTFDVEIDSKKLLEKLKDITDDKVGSKEPAVYLLVNSKTGKYYIGATSNQQQRKKTHLKQLKGKQHINHKLQKAYDEDAGFAFKPLIVKDVETAFILEKILLKEHKKDLNILNLTGSASVTSESRKKQSDAHIQRFKDNPHLIEDLKKQTGSNNPFFGKTHSVENKDNHSLFQKEQWNKPGYKLNQSILAKKRWESNEFRENQIKTNTEAWSSPAIRAIVSEKAKQRMADPVFIANLSAKQTDRMKNPDLVNLSRQGAIKQWEDPRMREKLCRSLTIDGKTYESAVTAGKQLNICYATIRSRAFSSNFPSYFFNN